MGNYIALQYYDSPCGNLMLASLGDKLCMCDWTNNPHRALTDKRLVQSLKCRLRHAPSSTISETTKQLDEYFAGTRNFFTIPLLFAGSEFQISVWNALTEIKYGKTCSYQHISNVINRPKATRAVANAIGANPISIIVPCHRVIGSNGSLTGYAGGINTKQYLLSLETTTTNATPV